MRILVLSMLIAAMPACGGGDASPATITTSEKPPASATVDHYAAYVALAGDLGGEVVGKTDAATRASISCGDGGPAYWKSAGISIVDSPTDLALVRAYCPEREAALGG